MANFTTGTRYHKQTVVDRPILINEPLGNSTGPLRQLHVGIVPLSLSFPFN